MQIPDNEPEYKEEEPLYNEPGDNGPEDAVDIYSKWAIFGFTIFFGPIFGGALLYQNLKDVGYRRDANNVLFFSIVYQVLPTFILLHVPPNMLVWSIIIWAQKLIGGGILSFLIFPRYFPENDYYPKSIWPALFKSIIIIVIMGLIAQRLLPMGMLPQLK